MEEEKKKLANANKKKNLNSSWMLENFCDVDIVDIVNFVFLQTYLLMVSEGIFSYDTEVFSWYEDFEMFLVVVADLYFKSTLTQINRNFVSFMNDFNIRLASVNESLYLEKNFVYLFYITSNDVIHSWTIPSFGLKLDAIPGRLNGSFGTFARCGRFYGQCSELCGVNHAFMPFVINVF